MNLIVGLGNPGRGYVDNRHNIGFICLNHFARMQGLHFDKKQGQALIGLGVVAGNEVIVAKPQTFMNSSGQAVSRLVKKFDVNLDNLFIIHDDLDLSLGKIRIRQGSSSGGHKGIDSIIAELGSRDFVRIRVGIGRPVSIEDSAEVSETDIIDYVLSDFTPDENEIIAKVIPRVSEAILCLLADSLVAAMNKYNG